MCQLDSLVVCNGVARIVTQLNVSVWRHKHLLSIVEKGEIDDLLCFWNTAGVGNDRLKLVNLLSQNGSEEQREFSWFLYVKITTETFGVLSVWHVNMFRSSKSPRRAYTSLAHRSSHCVNS